MTIQIYNCLGEWALIVKNKALSCLPLGKSWKYYVMFGNIFYFPFSKTCFWEYKVMILPKISRLVSIERWWLQDLILKAKNKSEETGQRSSVDEVSKFILHNRKREFFWRKLKVSESLTSSLESVYIVFVERLLICLVIVAMVEGCNRSSLLVSVLYRPNEEFSE